MNAKADRPAAEFIGSFPDPLHKLDPVLPEIAFIGRSNVGKSSLLNALVGAKGLAKVSATPGKTQTMNVFRIGEGGREYYLVDLPGYGYAKTSKTNRAGFAVLIQRYLTERPTVIGIAWLLDIRHDPSKEDLTMAELLGDRGLPALGILTKADKLGTAAARTQARQIARTLGLTEEQTHVTSSKSGAGIADLRATIEAALGGREE
jgi:GTP-binding protein